MGLDSPRPYNWYEDMDVWQKKTGAKMMGFFLFAAVWYSKGNVVLLQVCYVILTIQALIQLCTQKSRGTEARCFEH